MQTILSNKAVQNDFIGTLVSKVAKAGEALKEYITKNHDSMVLYQSDKDTMKLQGAFTILGAVGGLGAAFSPDPFSLSAFAVGTALSVGMRPFRRMMLKMEEVIADINDVGEVYKSSFSAKDPVPVFNDQSDSLRVENIQSALYEAKTHMMPFANAAERNKEMCSAIKTMSASSDFINTASYLANLKDTPEFRTAFINANRHQDHTLPHLRRALALLDTVVSSEVRIKCAKDILEVVDHINDRIGVLPKLLDSSEVRHISDDYAPMIQLLNDIVHPVENKRVPLSSVTVDKCIRGLSANDPTNTKGVFQEPARMAN
jgi:hypothetical protein